MARIEIPYAPRRVQLECHEAFEPFRFRFLVAHRRLGKTVFWLNELQRGALLCKKDRPRFAYVAPFLKQAKQVAWDYLRHYAKPIPGIEVNESELRVDYPNGGRVQLFGADNPDAMRGLYFDGAVLDEYGQMRPRLLPEVVRPALADRQGWLGVSGTPNGLNAFHDLYQIARSDPAWVVREYRASETGIIPQDELDAARRMMSAEQYDQEFELSWSAAVRGAYFARLLETAEREGRVTGVPYEPLLPVGTAWDLGVGDSTAIVFWQAKGREVRLIETYENEGQGLAHYLAVLRDKSYRYGRHLVPHDAAAREMGSGLSLVEQAAQAGVRFEVVPRVDRKEHAIEAARNLIPRCWIDAVKCKDGLDAWKSYRRAENQTTGELRDTPLHDWSSHYADALMTLAQGYREQAALQRRPEPDLRWIR